jgi:hypothetical protein
VRLLPSALAGGKGSETIRALANGNSTKAGSSKQRFLKAFEVYLFQRLGNTLSR